MDNSRVTMRFHEILQFSIVFIFAIFLVIHTVLKEQNALFLRDSGHSALRMNILQ